MHVCLAYLYRQMDQAMMKEREDYNDDTDKYDDTCTSSAHACEPPG